MCEWPPMACTSPTWRRTLASCSTWSGMENVCRHCRRKTLLRSMQKVVPCSKDMKMKPQATVELESHVKDIHVLFEKCSRNKYFLRYNILEKPNFKFSTENANASPRRSRSGQGRKGKLKPETSGGSDT